MSNLFEEDREILRRFQEDSLPREGFDPDFHYVYEYRGANGIHVHQAKTLGYEIVRGAMPENPGMRDENGHCIVGDTVLMRIPKAKHEQLERVGLARMRRHLGETEADAIRASIDERISKLVDHDISVAFQFKDQRDLRGRK